ncbi:TlpA disulfide reductase family protein [Aliikangiella marina]|nr:TlpA disulfide reductase family protein [Aliikangiella marina]
MNALFLAGCSQNGEFMLMNGEKRSLDDYQGSWVVVNFWAEWCAPCLEEVPELNKIHGTSADQPIQVIGVSFDPLENQQITAIINKWKIKYPVMASDPVPILPFGLPAQLPTNYLINPQGEVVEKLIGKQSAETILKAIGRTKNKN